jgi:hypothetical protein
MASMVALHKSSEDRTLVCVGLYKTHAFRTEFGKEPKSK